MKRAPWVGTHPEGLSQAGQSFGARHKLQPRVLFAALLALLRFKRHSARWSAKGGGGKVLRLGLWLLLVAPGVLPASNVLLDDSAPLYLPAVGDHQLRLLSPTLLELTLVTTKAPDPAPVTQWNFVDSNGNLALPDPSQFLIKANGQQVLAQVLGFKRRVLYAALNTYDLRIANYLYLELTGPVSAGSALQVQNPSGALWAPNVLFTLTVDPLRYSPALHVNQVGYVPALPKKGIVGYYLGSFGELNIPTAQGFQLISTQTSNTVFSGTLVRRPEVGWLYSPTPYQQVYEADFSAFQTPGQYKLVVPGLGASLPFLINDGVAAAMTRAYELGIYGQRCGTNNALPFTRFVHGPCHTNVAQVPTLASPEFDFANYIANVEGTYVGNNPPQTAPLITNAVSSLYPFDRQGTVDVSGGHHDAGDYSKYTINVAQLIHYLVFAVDAFPGVASLDNLGIPESGDGISDCLQEAKWEADFLVKMQDTDGGFYFNIYPKNRQFETDVLPDHGDSQIVMPKTTSATAAAVGALAEIASSPAFKAAYPSVAANYLAKAQAGWAFLTNAFYQHSGRTNAFQTFSSLGDSFTHNDELAWAAAALYGATGNTNYDNDLRLNTPNPNDPSVRLYGWLSMFEGYGCAFRDYAFAARTGRLQPSQLNATYLAQCQAEILNAATNTLQWSADNAYGTSFFDINKPLLTAGWYFSSERAFDLTVEYQLNPLPAYLDAILRNFNYENGCNPVNISFVTGLGWKRQRQIVDQYSENDNLVLPRSGLPLGNIQQGFDYLALYGAELAHLSYPSDGATFGPYPMYDRWGDAWNGPQEFVVSEQSSRALGTAAWLMAQTTVKAQVWKSATAQIAGVPATALQGQSVSSSIVSSGLDLSQALIVWDVTGQQPGMGPTFAFSPYTLGTNQVQVEAQLPDGRRVSAITNLFTLPTNTPPPLATNADMVALYRLSTDFSDATRREANLTPYGAAALDPIGLHLQGNGDYVWVNLPNPDVYNPTTTQAISVEGRFYINSFSPEGRASYPLALVQTLNTQLTLYQGAWVPVPDVYGGLLLLLPGTTLTNTFTVGQWHELNVMLTKTNYSVTVDGLQILSTNSAGVLTNWLGSGTIQLQAGDFNGWLQNLVVRNVQPPRLSSLTRLAGDGAQLSFPGSAGISYTVRASTNLVNWSVIGAATQSPVVGTFQFTDIQATNYPKRFYRVSVP